MNHTTKVYQAHQSVNDVAVHIDGTIKALFDDHRLRHAEKFTPNIWDYKLNGWLYFLCQCLMVRWLGGGETTIENNPFTSMKIRDARIVARKANLDENSIEWKENNIEFAPNYDIRFSFEFISLNKTRVTVSTHANAWGELLSRITAEWESLESTQEIETEIPIPDGTPESWEQLIKWYYRQSKIKSIKELTNMLPYSYSQVSKMHTLYKPNK